MKLLQGPLVRTCRMLGVTFGLLLAFGSAVMADDVYGTWLTKEGKSKVVIEPCNGKVCGHIVWLREPLDDKGQPKLDRQNKKEELRERPLIGLPLLTGFVPGEGKGVYEGGNIYNPEDGKTYSSEMALQEDGTLKVEGCVLFFCKEQFWTPAQ